MIRLMTTLGLAAVVRSTNTRGQEETATEPTRRAVFSRR